MLIDNVLLKEIPRACYLRPFCFPEVRSAGEFENFSMFRWLFFFLLLLLIFGFFLFFRSFFFVPRGKSSVSSLGCFYSFFLFKISCWDVFFILCVHSCVRGSPMRCLKVFFASMSPMWVLKVFSVEVTNVGFKGILGCQWLRARLCCRKTSDSIFWLYYFTPR